MSNKRKKCFVITPIGEENTDIRRHIDGVIDHAIKPAIGYKYEIVVAHRKYEIGSISERVIRDIYEADLAIANLTTLNPNVMFELAIRYSFGKPTIVIAEKGTDLPFDIIDENTIFYVNDQTGGDELKRKLREFEGNINCENHTYGPVYKVIGSLPLLNAIESKENVSTHELMLYFINRLNSLEKIMTNIENNDIEINNNLVYSRKAKVVEVKYRTEKIKDRNSLEMRIAKLRNTYDGIIINSYNTEEGYKVYIDFAIIDSLYKEFIEELKKIVNYYAQGCEIVEGIVQF